MKSYLLPLFFFSLLHLSCSRHKVTTSYRSNPYESHQTDSSQAINTPNESAGFKLVRVGKSDPEIVQKKEKHVAQLIGIWELSNHSQYPPKTYSYTINEPPPDRDTMTFPDPYYSKPKVGVQDSVKRQLYLYPNQTFMIVDSRLDTARGQWDIGDDSARLCLSCASPQLRIKYFHTNTERRAISHILEPISYLYPSDEIQLGQSSYKQIEHGDFSTGDTAQYHRIYQNAKQLVAEANQLDKQSTGPNRDTTLDYLELRQISQQKRTLLERSRDSFQLAHQKLPFRHSDLYMEWGQTYGPIFDLKDAEHLFTLAILLDNTQADYFIERGICHDRMKDFEGAWADFSWAALVEPENPRAYAYQAFFLQHHYQADLALPIANRSLEINPDYAFGYLVRSKVLKRLGETEKSKIDYAKYKELSKKPMR